jgi:hypothetical protein
MADGGQIDYGSVDLQAVRLRENPGFFGPNNPRSSQVEHKWNTRPTDAVRLARRDEILRLFCQGFKVKDIASQLGVSYYVMRRECAQPGFMEALKEKNAEIWSKIDQEVFINKLTSQQQIAELSGRALERIAEMMESEDERIVVRACDSVLDRNPETSKQHKVQTTEIQVKLDAGMLALAATAAFEMDRQAPPPAVKPPVTIVAEDTPDGK